MKKQKEIDAIVDDILFIKPIFFKALINAKGIKALITPGTYYIMLALEKSGALSMSQISKEVSMPKPNVTPLVDKLICTGLAERISDGKDRRIINIKLTKSGLKNKKEVDKALKAHTYEKLKDLSLNDLNLLAESLTKVKNILAKLPK